MERIKLDPLVNKLVWFTLHELAENKDAVIRAVDMDGYWIEGGSLAEHVKSTMSGGDSSSDVQFIEYKRIHSIQMA